MGDREKEVPSMPFAPQVPRPFNVVDVRSLRRGQNGVYGLLDHGGRVIYVGKGDVRERLLAHLLGDNFLITRACPVGWVAEATSGDPSKRERELILEFLPVCNRRVG